MKKLNLILSLALVLGCVAFWLPNTAEAIPCPVGVSPVLGNANNDCNVSNVPTINISDMIDILRSIFNATPLACRAAANIRTDAVTQVINIQDAITGLNTINAGGFAVQRQLGTCDIAGFTPVAKGFAWDAVDVASVQPQGYNFYCRPSTTATRVLVGTLANGAATQHTLNLAAVDSRHCAATAFVQDGSLLESDFSNEVDAFAGAAAMAAPLVAAQTVTKNAAPGRAVRRGIQRVR